MTMAPDNTEQIPMSQYWNGEPGDPQRPAYGSYPDPTPPPPPPVPPLGEARNERPRPRRRFAETAGVALLAAVLASGGTYAVTQSRANGGTAATQSSSSTTNPNSNSSPTVVQGNALAPDWSAVAKAVSPSVVSINVTTGQGGDAGSGVVFDGSGHILTNNHVVAAASGNSQAALTVTLADGRTYAATIVGTDPSTDLAIIKVTKGPSDLTPITLGDSEAITVGDPVMAVGNPLGLSGTVTTGIVSALNRPVSTGAADQSPLGNQSQSEPVVTNAIQTSAAINPGNSGGALVNAKGELIGINSSIASLGQSSSGSQSGNIGIGFAIPVKEAKVIADQLIKSGKAEHAFLGVSSRDTVITDGSAKRAGAQIVSVASGTPAAKAGLKNGDVITAVNGEPVDSATALVGQVRELAAGDQAKLTVFRDGAKQTISVTLAVKPDTAN
ncbi:peptidase S1 [Humibacillus sp. DSM 29435]|uniref:S1C family serine protease n=1 Tax=Humibacillus sp. DSM 29435 TaxID=1869167 RepID=UPI0008721640|nr:trypsin-like peptidase domain-containing protein [Humibacillus sp. DSM 29435]OFE14976.1 peptidase S1 [Humibacillus sp. DSM 29435]